MSHYDGDGCERTFGPGVHNLGATPQSPVTDVDVTECPDCGQRGRYDGRVLIGGRGIYTCPEGHRWQDANEKPTTKGLPLAGQPTTAEEADRGPDA